MATKVISSRVYQRIDTRTNWNSKNPVLGNGELGIESDTRKMKVGDGVTAWNALQYSAVAGGVPFHNDVGGDVNNIRSIGCYSGYFTNSPQGSYGSLLVQHSDGDSTAYVNQIWIPEGQNMDIWYRTTNSASSWGAWCKLAKTDYPTFTGTVAMAATATMAANRANTTITCNANHFEIDHSSIGAGGKIRIANSGLEFERRGNTAIYRILTTENYELYDISTYMIWDYSRNTCVKFVSPSNPASITINNVFAGAEGTLLASGPYEPILPGTCKFDDSWGYYSNAKQYIYRFFYDGSTYFWSRRPFS